MSVRCLKARVAVPVLALAACGAILTGAPPSATALDADEVCESKPAAARLDFALKDISGATVRLAALKGRVVVLNFWATWCVPCKAEIPDFIDLQARYAGDGLQVVGVSVDDPLKRLKSYVDEKKMNYPVLQGRGHDDLLDAYSLSTLPVTVLIGRDGIVCRRQTGPIAKDLLERAIKSLL
jgi:peroxiredoxin